MRYIGLIFLLAFCTMGFNIYHNTHVLNSYWDEGDKQSFRYDYEETLQKFRNSNQPFISSVSLDVDLYPMLNTYTIKGYYTLYNPHKEPINEIHIQKYLNDHTTIDTLFFNQGFKYEDKHHNLGYFIHHLDSPLLSGDSLKMGFTQSYQKKGFEDGASTDGLMKNGSFINYKHLPTLGYNDDYEINDDKTRKQLGLEPRIKLGSIDDINALKINQSGSDAALINLEIKISTDSDQVAVAPGELIEQYLVDGRAHYHYKMSRPTINFYAFLSGRYEIKKDTWQSFSDEGSINLEIYHHPTHDYNVDRMMESMKHTLSYCSENFSAYPYKQLRIVEFPRYATFAQSFPTIIPFSESIGFMLDIDDEVDVDMAYYITAHEAAHQWWGIQLETARVQGENMILESLAQYAAIMILKEKYPQEKIDQFLAYQRELYEKEKKRNNEEPPLYLVEDQEYIYYNKGVINMYALQEKIGEENVNQALATFLKDWNSTDGIKNKKYDRYATSKDLIGYFIQESPVSQVHEIEKLFY